MTLVADWVKRDLLLIDQVNQSAGKSRSVATLTAAVAAILVALLAPAPANAVNTNFFGIVPVGTPSDDDFEAIGAAKVGSYRFEIDWRSIQPTADGPYDWATLDTRMTNAARNGLEPLPFFYGSPDYAADNPRQPPLGSAEAKDRWKTFLRAVAERYGPDGDFWGENPDLERRPIKVWQIWNEVNSRSYYKPKPSPKEYARLLKISHAALTDVDSNAKILLAGMFATPGRSGSIYSWRYLKRLYGIKGTERRFDAVALHPYSPNLSGIKAQIRLARKGIKKAGGGRPKIWITELGWGSAGSGSSDLIKSEAGQKRLLRKSFKLLIRKRRAWGIKRLFWFTWRDPADPSDPTGIVCTWCASAGLLDTNGQPKPSFEQFVKFTGGG